MLLLNQTTKLGRDFKPTFSVDPCRVVTPEHRFGMAGDLKGVGEMEKNTMIG